MTVVRMPGRNSRTTTRVDTRNCYMTDAEALELERRVMDFERTDAEHNFPAVVWWAVVAGAALGSFFAGLLLGSQS